MAVTWALLVALDVHGVEGILLYLGSSADRVLHPIQAVQAVVGVALRID